MRNNVNRELLKRQLARASQIQDLSLNQNVFRGEAGYGGLAAQLATAGIGAWAKNKAEKALAAQELESQQAFAKLNPDLANFASQLGPEARENISLKRALLQTENLYSQPQQRAKTIKETERGLFAIDPVTAEATPITIDQQQLRSKRKDPLVEVKTGELETQEQKALGKVFAKKYVDITESGNLAQRSLDTLETLEKAVLNPKASQGAFSKLRTETKKIQDLFGFETEGLGDDAIIASIGNRLALQLRSPKGEDGGLTGATSDRDLSFLIEGVPNRNKTMEQNLALIDIAKRDKLRTLALKDLADKYLEENNTFRGFAKVKKEFFENNPLYEEGSDDKEKVKALLSGETVLPMQEIPAPRAPVTEEEVEFLGFENGNSKS